MALQTPADTADLDDEQITSLLQQASEQRKLALAGYGSSKVDNRTVSIPRLRLGSAENSDLHTESSVVRYEDEREGRKRGVGIRKVEDPLLVKTLANEKKEASAGAEWFDLPKTVLTPELKRDLQLLKMRNVLDPHRHYRKDNGKMNVPQFSQVGTIVEGATEFYSGRIENKKRKRTFVEEVLAGEKATGRFQKRYGEVQLTKASGKKAFYRALQTKRKTGVRKGG